MSFSNSEPSDEPPPPPPPPEPHLYVPKTIEAGPRPPARPVRLPPPQRRAPGHTDLPLRAIVTGGHASAVFYLAAAQHLVHLLKYVDDQHRQIPHDSNFINMVATILLETVHRQPTENRRTHYDAALNVSIGRFSTWTKPQQIEFLNTLWEDCYKRIAPRTKAAEMVDGEAVVTGMEGLPSSIRVGDLAGFFARIAPGPKQNAWKAYKIGFRVDGGRANDGLRDDRHRILHEGFVPLQKQPALAVEVVKKFYHEHPSSVNPYMYFGYQNRDLYNESGICVARSLLGATAFPLRDTMNGRGSELEYQYLWALNCDGLSGVDTEAEQLAMANYSLWRPGEKAFPSVAPDRILGFVTIVRCGKPSHPVGSTGWSFRFPVTGEWVWVNPPDSERMDYLNAELATWRADAQYNIPETYDFQVKPPPPSFGDRR